MNSTSSSFPPNDDVDDLGCGGVVSDEAAGQDVAASDDLPTSFDVDDFVEGSSNEAVMDRVKSGMRIWDPAVSAEEIAAAMFEGADSGEVETPQRISPDLGPGGLGEDWSDPDVEAIEFALEEGLVWIESHGWVTREDAELEVGEVQAALLFEAQRQEWKRVRPSE